MQFQLNDEQNMIREAVREFGEKEIRPIAREYDEKKKYPRELIREAAKYDLVGPGIPEPYGGAEMDPLSGVIVTEELWRADPGVGGAIALADFGSKMILDCGDDRMKQEWLPQVTEGKAILAVAISEPGHGSNIKGMETRATKDNGDWVINGNKMWISNGNVADAVVVMAKTDPEQGHRGISAFLVPTDRGGFKAEPIKNKLGIRASDLAELILNDVRIPSDHLIGEENQGFYQLMDFLNTSRVHVGAQAVGVSQAALDASVEYAQEREQFDQPIANFQAIQHKLAEMAAKTEASRALTYRAASMIPMKDDPEFRKMASMAKYYASERAVEVTDEAIQIFGGSGYVSDFPVERYFRDARITKIYEGTSEIHKNIIASSLLS